MQFPTQVQSGFYQNRPMPMGYPVGANPLPTFGSPFQQGPAYGPPPGYPMGGQPPIMGGYPPMMGGQFRGPQMSPFPQQPLLMGYRPMMGPPQPYRPIHPDQSPLSRPSNINTKIEEQKIHCVVCDGDFLVSEKEQHARKHARPRAEQGSGIKKLMKEYQQQYTGPKTRPIVEPEEYNIQYNPNQFILEQIYNYETPVIEKRQAQRKQIGVGTANVSRQTQQPQIQPQPIVQSQVQSTAQMPVQNQSVAFQPQTVRLTKDGQQIITNTGNVYDAAAERRFRESQLSNNNIRQPSVQPSVAQPSNDARFTRQTFISDQPVPAVQPTDPIMRQTIYGDPNAPKMVASRQPDDSRVSQAQSVQPIQTNQDLPVRQPSAIQKVNLDQESEGMNSAYRSTYQRKYDGNDYVRQTQTQMNNTTPVVAPVPISNSFSNSVSNQNPYNSVQPSQNLDASRVSEAPSISQQSNIQPQKLQSSRPPTVQNSASIFDNADSGYGRSPDDKIIPREARSQNQTQSQHDYFPFQSNQQRLTNTQTAEPRLTTTQPVQPRLTTTQPAEPRLTVTQPADLRQTNLSNIQPTQPRLTNVQQSRQTNISNIQPTQTRMTNVQPTEPRQTVSNAEEIRMSSIINEKNPTYQYQTAGYEAPKIQQTQPINTNMSQSGISSNEPPQNQPLQSSFKPTNSVQAPANDWGQSFDYPQRNTTVQQPIQQSVRQPTQNFQQSFNKSVSETSLKPVNQSFNQSASPAANQSVQDPFKDIISSAQQSPTLDANRLTNNAGTSQRIGGDVSLTENYQPAPLPILQPTNSTQNTTTRKKLPRFVGTQW